MVEFPLHFDKYTKILSINSDKVKNTEKRYQIMDTILNFIFSILSIIMCVFILYDNNIVMLLGIVIGIIHFYSNKIKNRQKRYEIIYNTLNFMFFILTMIMLVFVSFIDNNKAMLLGITIYVIFLAYVISSSLLEMWSINKIQKICLDNISQIKNI